jgi:hypothetical protein
MRRELIVHELELSLQEFLQAPRLRVIEISGERPAIDERREPWIPIKYGPAGHDDWFGVVPATVRFERSPGAASERLDLAIKVNPEQGLARTLIPWIVEHQKIALDRPYWEYRCAAESDHTGAREPHLYALAKSTPELSRVLPRCYGASTDAATGEHALFLEFITEVTRLDATGALADWPPDAIDAALRSAAGWQAAFWDLQQNQASWAGRRPTTKDMIADVPLWRGLLDEAHRRFPDIIADKEWHRRYALIDSLEEWHPAKDLLPATLAHNDFNQRNVGFRPGVLVLDWEIVEYNTAHRDLVELLTFVLPPRAERGQADSHVETHRAALIALGVSTGVDRDHWIEGFRCELKVEAINRIGMQLLFATQFPLAYLARINHNIERLLDLYE